LGRDATRPDATQGPEIYQESAWVAEDFSSTGLAPEGHRKFNNEYKYVRRTRSRFCTAAVWGTNLQLEKHLMSLCIYACATWHAQFVRQLHARELGPLRLDNIRSLAHIMITAWSSARRIYILSRTPYAARERYSRRRWRRSSSESLPALMMIRMQYQLWYFAFPMHEYRYTHPPV
jgi:hypothetical protein